MIGALFFAGATAAPTVEERRDAAEQTLQRLMDEKRYDEAANIAADLVALTESLAGDQRLAMADALTRLGTAQTGRGDLIGAEKNFHAAVELIEGVEGPGSPALIAPLTGLAETYAHNNDHLRASELYGRALLLKHAESGFYNLEQLPILDSLSESHLALNKLGEANVHQRRQVAIQRRHLGRNNPELAPALFKLGRWYSRTGQYPESRQTFQEARRIIRDAGGDKDPALVDALVDALIGEALSYGNEGDLPGSAATMKRALTILDAQPEPDHLKRADVLVALGDMHVVFRLPTTARKHYAEAWRDLSGEDPTLTAQREAFFAHPTRITGPRLPEVVDAGGKEQTVRHPATAYADGIVIARFSVDTDGLAQNASIVESIPPGLLDRKVLKALAHTAFRPQIVDGVAVVTDEVQFRHTYRYLRTAAPAGSKDDEPDDQPIAFPDEPDQTHGEATP